MKKFVTLISLYSHMGLGADIYERIALIFAILQKMSR